MGQDNKIKYCPVTGNQPLRCTESGFRISCSKFRAMAADKPRFTSNDGRQPYVRYCLDCGGTVPGNVQFIQLPSQKNKSDMGSAKRVPGVCEACGKKTTVSTHYGKMVCSTCLPIRMGAKQHPQIVIDSLVEFGNIPAGVVRGSTELQSENDKLCVLFEEKTEQITGLLREQALLNHENAVLKEELRKSSVVGNCLDAEAKAIMNDLVWIIAEGVMENKISGIKVDDLRLMRSLF